MDHTDRRTDETETARHGGCDKMEREGQRALLDRAGDVVAVRSGRLDLSTKERVRKS